MLSLFLWQRAKRKNNFTISHTFWQKKKKKPDQSKMSQNWQ